jgi:peroxiredoxin
MELNNLQEFQKLVIANASKVKGLSVGERAPDFTLTNALSKEVSLSEVLRSGIVIIKFYRGEWCPICNLDLKEIEAFLPQISSLGASVIAISPQKPDDALTAKEKNNLSFEVLSDVDQKVIKLYNLQFDPGDDYHQRRDLALLNGNGFKTLPVPATFIVNSNQIIEAAHVEANYTERMKPLDIVAVLKSLSTKA